MNDSAGQQRTAVVVEDDPDIQALLIEVFRSAGFNVVAASNGLEGVEAVREHQPIVTSLDVNMPGIDGLEAARRIRKFSRTYIIMLSALGTEADIVLGLSAGADEYVVKPFRPREMRARVEAMLRRPRMEGHSLNDTTESAAAAPSAPAAVAEPVSAAPARPVAAPADASATWLTHHDLRVNTTARSAIVGEREIDLTGDEYALLSALVESKRRVRSKSDLSLVLRGEDFVTSYYVGEADKRAVEAHMVNLRRKIGDNATDPRYIETVRGVGYRLTP